MKYGIVVSRFNEMITEALLGECLKGFKEQGISPVVLKVPGAVELALAAQKMIEHESLDAVVALGAVIKGETEHYDMVNRWCTDGLREVSLKFGVPIVFEVLMTDSYQKAEARIEKAYHAAFVATEMATMYNAGNE